jgi:hypothetical protein
MSYELAQKYAEFEIPKEIKSAYKAGVQLAGSLGFTKIMMFANENQITNDDIDWFTNRPPRTMEGESYEDMKMRTKLANAFYKYRAYLYDYSVYEKQKI